MNTSRVVSVFLVCFSLALSAPLPQTSSTAAQKWNQEMLQLDRMSYAGYVACTLVAASSGKNYFEQPEPLTEDCVRTARVAMTLLTQPSTMPKTKELLTKCLTATIPTSNENPAEIMCKNTNEAIKQNEPSFPDFGELKKKVELPKPAKNYIAEIPQETNAREFAEKQTIYVDNDPELIKFDMMTKFFSDKHARSSNAIVQLSLRDASKSTADSVFIQARDDYLKDLLAKNETKILTGDNNFDDFAEKVDEYFLKNSALKEDYEKLKEEY
ncbi:hypothetical protein V9T40_005969 [Parthenolecanium corni]|uniref:Uncharacterized protein n=1 Tax=Parthenolecanium corni TaxID=536013 RepID=A0AAN9TV54_9HEMI